jgi:hypothetical protein
VFGAEAVGRLLHDADRLIQAGRKEQAIERLHKALRVGLRFQQAAELAERLQRLEVPVDLPEVTGVISPWRVIGPFPVTPEEGLQASLPPETRVDLAAEYPGTSQTLRWSEAVADPREGRVDLVPCGIRPADGAVAYAATWLELAQSRNLVLHASAVDNMTVWVNGERVVHHASLYRSHYRQDRYRAEISLPAGTTTILVKLCKTPPDTERGAAAGRMGAAPAGRPEKWDFMLRCTDETGRGVRLPVVPAGP